jgi:glycerol-1-phosphate dehydrogenase [NAD(P)+]
MAPSPETLEKDRGHAAIEQAGDILPALLKGEYRDRETGAVVAAPTRQLVIEDTLDGAELELVERLGFGQKIALIADATTYEIMGRRVNAALSGRYDLDALVLPVGVYPDDATVARLTTATTAADAFIAVGSGTINDLAKYVSARERKPYCVFATAPSMNGYVSLTASITVKGHKGTLPAQPPAGAFFDLRVLAAAPKRMIRAGLGDSICRTTAQADWLLSHLLLDTTYRQLPFDLLEDDEAALLESAEDLVNGSLEAMRLLARTLVLSGFGTAIVGSSAPASQAEHLVSHYIDMLAPTSRPAVLHGEQIAVTTMSIARLQHAMLETRPILREDTVDEAQLVDRYGTELAGSVIEEFDHKRLDRRNTEEINGRLESGWNDIREQINAVLLSTAKVESTLRAAGAPLTPADVHLDRAFYDEALLHAREIRNRFTVLDLAAASGVLETLVHSL